MDLSRNPLAPARNASYTYSSRSYVVRISTRADVLAQIVAVAVMPSMPGIRTSISTTSGCRATAAAIASAPSPASPITVMSGSAPRMTLNP
jgi:hypothetical protein